MNTVTLVGLTKQKLPITETPKVLKKNNLWNIKFELDTGNILWKKYSIALFAYINASCIKDNELNKVWEKNIALIFTANVF